MSTILKKMKPYLPALCALLAGAAMTYGFAPYYVGIAPMISCAVFLGALKNQSAKKSFLIGWLYGLGMFGTGVSWIYVSIHDFGNASPVLASVITLGFVMGMAFYPAILGSLLGKFFPKQNAVRCIFAFPALWVIFEILRGWFLTGFPWLYVGYAEMGNHLSTFAPVGGVWLVSWMTVLFASLAYTLVDYLYDHGKSGWVKLGFVAGMFAIWAGAFTLTRIDWTLESAQKLDVALIQGNIPQLVRWDPDHISNIVRTYEVLTQQGLDKNVIIWPEAAIPLQLPLSAPLFKRMDNLLKSHNTALIAGVPTELPDGHHFYNSLVTAGNAQGVYHKENLVPFGEYVPFEGTLRGLIGFFDLPMSSMVSGPGNQGPLVAQGYTFAPAICYEIAYPMFVQKMGKDSDFILTVSNDAWFGNSIGPAQHLQIAQFRALEMGKYLLRATNTGYTAIVGPNGDIRTISPKFEKNVLTGTVAVMVGSTPWSRLGAWPVIAGLALTLLFAYVTSRLSK
jgi:apolipoprotein N-acyltransferase